MDDKQLKEIEHYASVLTAAIEADWKQETSTHSTDYWMRCAVEMARAVPQLTADVGRAREIAVALEQEIAKIRKIHRRSMFAATSGEWRGKHYCPACTYTDDGWTAYAVWPCATAAVFEGREAL